MEPETISLLREQWQGHAKARQELFAKALATVNGWIATAWDPELGNIGRRFSEDVSKSGCREEIDLFLLHNVATFCAFSLYREAMGFRNLIQYGALAEEDLARLYTSMVHEKTHAVQLLHSAALHGSPFNPATRIIICPRDWVTLMERCEQDAFAKQGWFGSLVAGDIPEIRGMTRGQTLSVETFEEIRARSENVAQALTEAARTLLEKKYWLDDPHNDETFRNYYHERALSGFKNAINARLDRNETDFIFVRIEPEDIEAIGNSCGPNIFGENGILPEFSQGPVLNERDKKTLAGINAKLGIGNEDDLPTLGEALAKLGLSRREFIASSYGGEQPLTVASVNQPLQASL